jgi:hypothetical protein
MLTWVSSKLRRAVFEGRHLMESPEELTQSDQALMTQKLACGTARSLLINFQQ